MWILTKYKRLLLVGAIEVEGNYSTGCIKGLLIGDSTKRNLDVTKDDKIILGYYENYSVANKIFNNIKKAIAEGKQLYEMPD